MSGHSHRYVSESRPLDFAYDPVYTRVAGAKAAKQAIASAQATSVGGKDRHLFFKRPVLPYLPPVPGQELDYAHQAQYQQQQQQQQVMLGHSSTHEKHRQRGQDDRSELASDASKDNKGVPMRTVGSQTVYRESAAQTDPYTPGIKPLEPGQEVPEVLSIQHLKWGQGLPAKLEEVRMIQHLREKREFEATLPPLTDQASFDLRRKLMEAQELKEWKLREEEMKQEQEARLGALVAQLRDREDKNETYLRQRVEHLRAKKMAEKAKLMEAIKRKRVKMHRGVEQQRRRRFVEPKSNKRDIVAEYGDFGSKVYAPKQREGKVPVHTQVQAYELRATQEYHELVQLEQNMPPNATQMRLQKPESLAQKLLPTRKEKQRAEDLNFVDTILKNAKEAKEAPTSEKAVETHKKFEAVVRPATPSVERRDLAPHRAALLVQRLLRGRLVQLQMLAGKEKCLELIRELQAKAQAQAHEQERLQSGVADTEDAEALEAKAQAQKREWVDRILGHLVSKTLVSHAREAISHRTAAEEKVPKAVGSQPAPSQPTEEPPQAAGVEHTEEEENALALAADEAQTATREYAVSAVANLMSTEVPAELDARIKEKPSPDSPSPGTGET